jgi:hypothetical protein
MNLWKKIPCTALACVLLTAATARAATIGLWLQDEGSGTVVGDSSGNGHHGAITWNGSWSTDSPFEPNAANSSLGGLREVQIPNATALNPSGDFTIEGWVSFQSLSGNPYLVSKRGGAAFSGYWLEASPASGTIDFIVGTGVGTLSATSATIGAGAFASLGPIQADVWYHVAGVHTATENILYINGISNGGSGTAPMVGNTSPLTFGYFFAGDKYGDFRLDEVRLSGQALSAAELGYNGSLAVPEPAGLLLGTSGLLFGLVVQARRNRRGAGSDLGHVD